MILLDILNSVDDSMSHSYFILKIIMRLFEIFAFACVSAVYAPALFARVMKALRRKRPVKELEEELAKAKTKQELLYQNHIKEKEEEYKKIFK